MKNVTYLGLCLAMTFGLVAVALGQQQSAANGQSAIQSAQPGQDAIAQPGAKAPPFSGSYANQNAAMPAPSAPQNGAMPTNGQQPGQSATSSGQNHGELGVWLVESGGPGVEIQRVTNGSAAEKAGLQEGDIVLQVNGRGASSPQATAQLIHQIPVGQTGMLTIWRDGDQRQLQITMQPAREMSREMRHQVGFGGAETTENSDLASRTMRLEQQLNTLTQELAAMRQEMAQLRAGSSTQSNGLNSETNQGSAPQGTTQQNSTPPATTSPAATTPTAPPPGFGQSEEKSAKPAAEPAKPSAAPTAEKPAAGDLFGSKPAPPKTEEKPKSDKAPKADSSTDSLFQ